MGNNGPIITCVDCGARIVGQKCDNCGGFVRLETYGYKVTKAHGDGYLLKENGQPIYSFKSTGSKTVGDLVERTGAPREIVERELALLASVKTHVEETEEETEILVKYKPSITARATSISIIVLTSPSS